MVEVDDPSPTYACPNCQAEVQVSSSPEPFIRCPQCGEEFTLPIEHTEADPPVELEPIGGLDARRIQQLVLNRQADIRLRSYLLIVSMGCFALAIVYAYRIGQWAYFKSTWHSAESCYVAIAVVAALGGLYLLTRAHRLMGKLSEPLLPDPATPLDFSQLGDGSQQAKALEELKAD